LDKANERELLSSAIPVELKSRNQWVCWRKLRRKDRKKPAKVPVIPKNGKQAKTNDPSTWGSFEESLFYYQNHKDRGIEGLGFVFSKDDPLVGIDLDNCRDQQTGEIEPWARRILEVLNSYTEISPSGSGLHIIVVGVLPPGKRKEGDVEMYDDVHYFTVTGMLLPGLSQSIERRQEEIEVLHARYLGDSSSFRPNPAGQQKQEGSGSNPWEPLLQELQAAELTPEDMEIIHRLRAGYFGKLYQLLFLGDRSGASALKRFGPPYHSDSQSDQAMLNKLAKLTGGSPTRMCAIFQESGLMRDKLEWHRTYLARSIRKAIDGMAWKPVGGCSEEEKQ
jgi:putative DNA primase/helicase